MAPMHISVVISWWTACRITLALEALVGEMVMNDGDCLLEVYGREPCVVH